MGCQRACPRPYLASSVAVAGRSLPSGLPPGESWRVRQAREQADPRSMLSDTKKFIVIHNQSVCCASTVTQFQPLRPMRAEFESIKTISVGLHRKSPASAFDFTAPLGVLILTSLVLNRDDLIIYLNFSLNDQLSISTCMNCSLSDELSTSTWK